VCHSLDAEGPPEAHVLEAWSPEMLEAIIARA
jgi:hypothetical protein